MKFHFTNHRLLLFFTLALSLALSACQTTGFSPQQIRVLEDQGFQPTDEGWELNLSGRLLFGFDDDDLQEGGRGKVEEVAQALLSVGLFQVRLDGHTDSVGSEDYNLNLSQRRASTVADVMVQSGMAAEDIEIKPRGSSMPIASNDTAEGRQENRRVAIVVVAH